ncbi:MAG: hypothetical protein ACW981_21385 [Candidatus Hodarchaeales archaeon]|jgi:hypothetical protein
MGKNMDRFVQEEVDNLRIVYNGKIPIQEIINGLTKKKEDRVRDSKNIDLSNLYEKIRSLISEKKLLSKDIINKNKVYIDRTNSKNREDGMIIIESLSAE